MGGVVYYRPSVEERIIAALVAVLGGLAYIAGVGGAHESGGVQSAVRVLTYAFMAALVGYIVVVILRELVTRHVVTYIARLRMHQARVLVKELCGREASEEEIVEALNKAIRSVAASRTGKKSSGRSGGDGKGAGNEQNVQ